MVSSCRVIVELNTMVVVGYHFTDVRFVRVKALSWLGWTKIMTLVPRDATGVRF